MRIAGFAWFLSGFVGAGYRAFTGCPQRPGLAPAGLREALGRTSAPHEQARPLCEQRLASRAASL